MVAEACASVQQRIGHRIEPVAALAFVVAVAAASSDAADMKTVVAST